MRDNKMLKLRKLILGVFFALCPSAALAWNKEAIITAPNRVCFSTFTEPDADGRVFEPLHVEVKYQDPEAFFDGPFGLAIAFGF